jgi:hypothetical protein
MKFCSTTTNDASAYGMNFWQIRLWYGKWLRPEDSIVLYVVYNGGKMDAIRFFRLAEFILYHSFVWLCEGRHRLLVSMRLYTDRTELVFLYYSPAHFHLNVKKMYVYNDAIMCVTFTEILHTDIVCFVFCGTRRGNAVHNRIPYERQNIYQTATKQSP